MNIRNDIDENSGVAKIVPKEVPAGSSSRETREISKTLYYWEKITKPLIVALQTYG